ncbi:hypothetical protein SB48_HM08orf01687 [Heyndrickxia coagulans]|uniref:Uncharacterized protein n=1 Tax=Heyndrickxia coagulans TaxID=1398 RepID=A0AAN0T4E1_HEYCO|nr:hypothetical protein SB48_HM08orf01687 [Heyndrickxia coagulans]
MFFHYQFQWQHSFSYFSVLFYRTKVRFSSTFHSRKLPSLTANRGKTCSPRNPF